MDARVAVKGPTEEQLERFDQLQERLCGAEEPDPQRVLTLCRDSGYVPLGLGSGRLALPLGRTMVAKVAWRESGLMDNEIEWRVWRDADDHLRSLLCPALSLRGSRLLAQGRCLPIAGSALEVLDQSARLLIGELARHGISDAAVNLGMNEANRIVCFDYAMIRPELFRSLFPGLVAV